jgi:hypothetical protein
LLARSQAIVDRLGVTRIAEPPLGVREPDADGTVLIPEQTVSAEPATA